MAVMEMMPAMVNLGCLNRGRQRDAERAQVNFSASDKVIQRESHAEEHRKRQHRLRNKLSLKSRIRQVFYKEVGCVTRVFSFSK